MANYASHLSPDRSQTSKDRNDQVQNSAGGFVYQLDDWKRLDRFLIIGSEGGSYYVSERDATIGNAITVSKLLNSSTENGRKVVDRVVALSDSGRAPKNDPALLVLALALSSTNPEITSYAADAVPKVARTATHLFTLVDYTTQIRKGWGRTFRRAVANWYNNRDAKNLAHQVCKYQSRTKEGSQTWSHKDLLRLAHVRPASAAHSAVLKYVVNGWSKDQLVAFKPSAENPFNYLYAHEAAKTATDVNEIVRLIKEYGLVRESIPTQFLNDKRVWNTLLEHMPITAMIRNLATMTRAGTIGPLADGNAKVVDSLNDVEVLKKGRVHPIQILNAMKTYGSGGNSVYSKSKHTWTPAQNIVDAMDSAFYKSFDVIQPTGKRIMLAIDCSSSMSTAAIGSMPNLSAREIAAALALVTAKTESNYLITGFTSSSQGQWAGYTFASTRNAKPTAMDGIQTLNISPRMRMDSVVREMEKFPWGGTDVSLPMLYAKSKGLKVDAFVVITDNETFQGTVKADEALCMYRKHSGIHDAKLIVVGCTATPFTIADPTDPNMLDVAGFDTATPAIIADFVRGDL